MFENVLHNVPQKEPVGLKNIITYKELSKHVFDDDCWIALKGHILDITLYLTKYTSDKKFFLANAGTDATYQFATRYKENKEAYTQSLIKKFSIGYLDYNSPKVFPQKARRNSRKLYNYSEINKHNKEDDCWVIIEDKVYDVTSFLGQHPGGPTIILKGGVELTKSFFENNHSQYAKELLSGYQIGVLDIKSKRYTRTQRDFRQSKHVMSLIGVIIACLLAFLLEYSKFF